MTRAAAAAAAVDIFAGATGTAGACAGVDNGDHGDGDDDCEPSVLGLSSGAYRMWKVKQL